MTVRDISSKTQPPALCHTNELLLLIDIALGVTEVNILIQLIGLISKEKVNFSKSAYFSAFSDITYRLVQQILPKLHAFNLFETGSFLRFNIALSVDYIFALHRTKRTGKANFQKGGGE